MSVYGEHLCIQGKVLYPSHYGAVITTTCQILAIGRENETLHVGRVSQKSVFHNARGVSISKSYNQHPMSVATTREPSSDENIRPPRIRPHPKRAVAPVGRDQVVISVLCVSYMLVSLSENTLHIS